MLPLMRPIVYANASYRLTAKGVLPIKTASRRVRPRRKA